MSESSSPTSSQLDDVDLAQPHSKQYEHDTDVGYMFGEQQWRSLGRGNPASQPAIDKAEDRSGFSGSSTRERIRAEPAHTSAEHALNDSECASHTTAHPQFSFHHQQRDRPSSEASDEACTRCTDASCTVTVDMLSPAFTLTAQAWQQAQHLGKSPADVICQRACTGLGVDRACLRYFELREVPATQLRAAGRYAVAVDRSGVHSYSTECFAST